MRLIGLVILTVSVTLAPLAAEAQPTPARLAMLLTGPPATATPEYAAFMKQLGDLGWIEGQNLAVDRRWADAPEKFIGLAADVVQSKPAVILAAGPDATRAAQQATSAIPIVMIASTDPRVLGATSLAHPGGNLTGLTIGQPEVTSEKRLQLLKEARPTLARVAVLWDVKRSADSDASVEMMAAAASVLGLRLQHLDVNGPSDFATAFAAAKRANAEAILLVESPRAVANRAAIAELGIKHRLAIMSQFSRIVEAGGLMSYGPDLSDLFRRAATDVDKILKGAKPADLPIEQPTTFDLVINLKTAKALGLTIPQTLLLRADQVIE
jgi:putative tryptophan/tyrosine transport system substrate-binding protein